MNPEASFKKYRDALASAAPPAIPFLYPAPFFHELAQHELSRAWKKR